MCVFAALLHSGVAVSALTAFGLVELLNHLKLSLLMACYHHLCYALALGDDKRLCREVDEQHAYLATVVGIDGSGRVEHSDAVLQCQAGAWAHLSLTDEFHQLFVPGRAGLFADVLIDTSGAAVAMLVVWLVCRVNKAFNKHR